MRIRNARFFVPAAVVAVGCLIATGCGGEKTDVSPGKGTATDIASPAFEVDDGQAAKLTRGNQGRIKAGMTLVEVTGILGIGPVAPAGAGEDKEYDLTWKHPATKKEITVKFKGSKVVSSSGTGL